MPDTDDKWYLVICHECDGDLTMPFTSAEERGSWCGSHTRGTGHDHWLVWDEPK